MTAVQGGATTGGKSGATPDVNGGATPDVNGDVSASSKSGAASASKHGATSAPKGGANTASRGSSASASKSGAASAPAPKGENFNSGIISITGRPNVGKSTLLNRIVGQKISIVTPRPQTTRNRILAVKNLPDAQLVFLDTPGIHEPKHRLGEIILRTAVESIREVDLVLLVVEPHHPQPEDLSIIEIVKSAGKTAFLVINKVDSVGKAALLPIIDEYSRAFAFAEIVPISALNGDGVNDLIDLCARYMPHGPKYYPDDIVTDRMERFMAAEIVREKLMIHTFEEIPHSLAVEVLSWDERKAPRPSRQKAAQPPRQNDGVMIIIEANIYIEKMSQKGIIIGSGGKMLKQVGTEARKDIERLLNARVHLKLFVKVSKDWRKNERILKELGYG
jgi:GTP-binding protein Era